MKVTRENRRADLTESFKDALADLTFDAARYDKGDFKAIKRSAITLRTLLYTNGRNTSIIEQLGLNSIKFATFAKDYSNFESAISFNNLLFARFQIKNNVVLKPSFYDTMLFQPNNPKHPINYLDFEDWWHQPLIVFKDKQKDEDKSLTRAHLVLKEANQDGPGHFDEKIDDIYQQYKNGKTGFVAGGINNPIVHQFYIGGYDLNQDELGKITHIRDVNLSLTRQIVHELLITVNKFTSYYVKYNPDFKYNFKRKLNYFAWNMTATK